MQTSHAKDMNFRPSNIKYLSISPWLSDFSPYRTMSFHFLFPIFMSALTRLSFRWAYLVSGRSHKVRSDKNSSNVHAIHTMYRKLPEPMTMIVTRFCHQSFINPCNWSVKGEDLVLVANTGTLQDVFFRARMEYLWSRNGDLVS